MRTAGSTCKRSCACVRSHNVNESRPVEFTILAFFLWYCATFCVGVALDQPGCAAMRARLAPPPMKLLGLILGFSPALSILTGSARRLAVLSHLDPSFVAYALRAGSIFTAALAGCWLALPAVRDPRCRPIVAFLFSLGIWLANARLAALR